MKRIIIADDDPGIQDVLKLILKRAGYETVIYDNADILLKNGFSEPDIFFIDRQLNHQDGLSVCRHLKTRENVHTPVIVFSASGRVCELAKEAGADDFLEKPFKIETLLNIIEKYTSSNMVAS